MKYLLKKNRLIRHLPILPFIYGAIIPLVLFDIWTEVYHRISFPLYGIPYIKRRDYIKIDRQKLFYLNPLQKISCAYCGYANGLLQYIVKIVAETEHYWCGIQHKQSKNFHAPSHHKKFLNYGDEEQYMREYGRKKTKWLF